MRFMMLMHPNISPEQYAEGPELDDVSEMQKFNEALTQSGALLAADGLTPPADGARVRFTGGSKTVTDGPFAEAKEIVGGYWIIDVSSKEEAVEWASRCPLGEGDFVEVRRVYEMSEFDQDLQDAAELSEEPREQTKARD